MCRLIIYSLFLFFSYSCQPEKNPTDQIDNKVNSNNNIRFYLSMVASDITNNALSGINTAEQWNEIRPVKLKEFQNMVSMVSMPLNGERPPLNVKHTGTIQMDGYRIEKLYYESLPDLYVPANLYIPDGITEPVPAVLYLCGHSRIQKTHYQAHPRKFAELGFVCLIVETIQYGEVWGEHWGCYDRGWFNWYSRGYTPAGVEVWNGIRGLDLLSDLPEVNGDKMGITGISGGGAISWFLGAVDTRAQVVAPVCGNSTLEDQISKRTIDGHCDCMMIINTYGWDFQDIGAMIAPRPLYIAQADRDGLNTVESSRKVFTELKDFYSLLGAEENIDFISTPGGHSYHKNSRQEIFSFFMKHLMEKEVAPEVAGDVDESPEAMLDNETLMVYLEGVPDDDRTKFIQDSFIDLAETPDIKNTKDLNNHRERVVALLKENTFHQFPVTPMPFDSVLEFRTLDRAQYGSDVYSFVSEEGWKLKVDFRWRNPKDEKNPLMIVLKSPGESRWASEEFISGLDENWNIAYIETRGVGENGWAPELQWHVRRASAWTGRTVASMRVYDALRCLEFCRTLENVDVSAVGIAGRNEMGVVAMYTALLDGTCHTLILKDVPPTLDLPGEKDGRDAPFEMLNALQITDNYQLPALLNPANIIFLEEMEDRFNWSVNTLINIGIDPSIEVLKNLEH
jgi:cephalosporin-C deacetylase-like acetyl esterase